MAKTSSKRASAHNNLIAAKRQRAAMTADVAVLIVGDLTAGVSIFPSEQGGLSAASSVADVRPGSQVTWYYRGPPGARVSVSVSRIQNTGGHIHPGGPSGTISPSSFVLGSNYPQISLPSLLRQLPLDQLSKSRTSPLAILQLS